MCPPAFIFFFVKDRSSTFNLKQQQNETHKKNYQTKQNVNLYNRICTCSLRNSCISNFLIKPHSKMNSQTLIEFSTQGICILLAIPFFLFGFVNLNPKEKVFSTNHFRNKISEFKKKFEVDDIIYLKAQKTYNLEGTLINPEYYQVLNNYFSGNRSADKEWYFFSTYNRNPGNPITIEYHSRYNPLSVSILKHYHIEKLCKNPFFYREIVKAENILEDNLELTLVSLIHDHIYIFKCKFVNNEEKSISEDFLLFLDHCALEK